MKRILEPEVMDTARDAEEYDAMDFAEPNTTFAVAALGLVESVSTPEILDIGTGTADIPVRMLQRNPKLRILGIDMAREMIRVGTHKVAAAGFSDQCRLQVLDAKALPFKAERFDMVMCNSTAHHIPDPLVLFKEMARVVKKDGALIARDLIRPSTMDDAWAIVRRAAAGEHIRQQQLFFDSLCAALTLEEVRDLAQRAGMGRVRVAQVSDRHWTLERKAHGVAKTTSS
jgi:ubiquinone/menaquinone biosynthesis C-methylase UbiE